MPHAVIKDKKTALYGVYNLKTKKYILPPSYRYIGTIGRGFLVCTLLEKKRKTIVLNNQYHVIDTLTEKKRFYLLLWKSVLPIIILALFIVAIINS
jgi:hypothetical protein